MRRDAPEADFVPAGGKGPLSSSARAGHVGSDTPRRRILLRPQYDLAAVVAVRIAGYFIFVRHLVPLEQLLRLHDEPGGPLPPGASAVIA